MNPDDRKLARWVRETLFFDVEDGTRNDAAADHILEAVYRRRDTESAMRTQRRRRRGWATVAGITALAAGSTAAAFYFTDQPSRPEAGATCRAAASVDAHAVALEAGVDPLDGCRQVWVTGRFGADEPVPPLTACIGPNGGVDVFPGDTTVCETLGLVAASPVLSPSNQAIITLQGRLVDEINAAECRPVHDVVVKAEQILSDSGLDGWQVVIEPGAEAGVCGKASLNSATRHVTVSEF